MSGYVVFGLRVIIVLSMLYLHMRALETISQLSCENWVLQNKLMRVEKPEEEVPKDTGFVIKNKDEDFVEHLWRVQIGAFKSEDNANKFRDRMVAHGFKDTFIRDEEGWYKVILLETKWHWEAREWFEICKGLDVQPYIHTITLRY